MRPITTNQLARLLESEAELELVEVLDRQGYETFHLPSAVSIPFDEDFNRQALRQLPSLSRLVVLYSWDEHCVISARAAEQLDSLGYLDARYYTSGKVGWRFANLPIDGAAAPATLGRSEDERTARPAAPKTETSSRAGMRTQRSKRAFWRRFTF